ncbi:MAG: hypothetical protein ACUZ8H_05395 [Candidatus Anammoxibacter sp.]
MARRSNFKRRKNDAYDTPYQAVLPLIPYLIPESSFCEPCAGKGVLIMHLQRRGFHCNAAYDIEPRESDIEAVDAMNLTSGLVNCADYIVTNPAWTRQILHPMIDVFRKITTTWLLLDAPWMHTKQAKPYMEYCSLIVSVGRVSWMENGISGKDDSCWYRFGLDKTETIFKGR